MEYDELKVPHPGGRPLLGCLLLPSRARGSGTGAGHGAAKLCGGPHQQADQHRPSRGHEAVDAADREDMPARPGRKDSGADRAGAEDGRAGVPAVDEGGPRPPRLHHAVQGHAALQVHQAGGRPGPRDLHPVHHRAQGRHLEPFQGQGPVLLQRRHEDQRQARGDQHGDPSPRTAAPWEAPVHAARCRRHAPARRLRRICPLDRRHRRQP
mmetsp:Transcript_26624/g.63087  ORF Transcript_26624/g.63087 Transcript_26624/m.63087 type:complete len:210 (-) Transcript_26624:937-1566(-)